MQMIKGRIVSLMMPHGAHLFNEGKIVGLNLFNIDSNLALAIKVILADEKRAQQMKFSVLKLKCNIHNHQPKRSIFFLLEYLEPFQILKILRIH